MTGQSPQSKLQELVNEGLQELVKEIARKEMREVYPDVVHRVDIERLIHSVQQVITTALCKMNCVCVLA